MKIPYASILFVLGTVVEAKKKKSKPKIGGSGNSETTTTTSSDSALTTTNGNPAISIYGFGNASDTFRASVVDVLSFASATTLAVTCPTTAALCPGGAMNITKTGANSIVVRATASSSGTSLSQDYSCFYIGTLTALCRERRVIAANNSTRTAYSALSSFGVTAAVPSALIEITAGKEKLPLVTAGAVQSDSGGASFGHTGNNLDRVWMAMTGAMGAVGALAFLL
ncbi:hypothetical protein CAC42_2250 [Sphaceloma murrayae]|uniref:Uncharacterized protein n=1 Tax=Sphaceloma murrayae TaxID=2082308 RepID=A0A2K1QJ89_9PEZI|nr:hypothetical protein CAC42_2250 [Sphaceloma murrayae]